MTLLKSLGRLAKSVKWLSKTHYDILKVNRNATSEEIKESYNKLSKKFHADKQQQDGESRAEFVKLTEAYRTLSQLESKKIYDDQLNQQSVQQSDDLINKGFAQIQSYWRLYNSKVNHPVYRGLIAVALLVSIVQIFLIFVKLSLFLTTVYFVGTQMMKMKSPPWKMFKK